MKGKGPTAERVHDLAQQFMALVTKTRDHVVDPKTGKYSLPGHVLAFYVFDGQPEIAYVVIKGALDPEMRCYPITVPAALHAVGGFLLLLEKSAATTMGMTAEKA